jgi:transcriptional regulator with XRE-family HTH domain
MTLHDWLEKSGMTQQEFAEKSGIPQPLVSRYSSGKGRPHLENALAIERATDGQVAVASWTKPKTTRAA